MQTVVTEQTVRLDSPVVEAVEAYPLPRLRVAGHVRPLDFEVVVLENEYVRASVCPALGGRVLSLVDKRSGVDVFGGGLRVVEGGPRGAWLASGLHVSVEPFVDSMARVDHLVHEDGAVLTYRLSRSGALGMQVCTTLHAGSAELLVEARVFNRTLRGVEFCLDAVTNTPVFPNHRWENGASRLAGPFVLAPRDTVAFQRRFPLYPSAAKPVFVNDHLCIEVSEGRIRVFSPRRMASHKIVLLTEDGQSLEAVTDLDPGVPFESEAPSRIVAVALLDAGGKTLFESRLEGHSPPEPLVTTIEPLEPGEGDPSAQPIHLRGAAYLLRAATCEASEARDLVDEALGTLSDDPLAWWQRAVLSRAIGDEEDPQVLETAHQLSPMEPALRAEGFLASEGATALLRPLGPDAVSNVACLLIEMGRPADAARLIEGALVNGECGLFRWVLGWLALDAGMDADAAAHVANATFAAPYPVHPIELGAVRELGARFPDDASLRGVLGLIEGQR